MDYDTTAKVIPCPPDPGVGRPDPGSFKQKPAPSILEVRDFVSRN